MNSEPKQVAVQQGKNRTHGVSVIAPNSTREPAQEDVMNEVNESEKLYDLSKTSSDPTGATATSKLARGKYLNLDGGKDREGKSMKKDANKELGSGPGQHSVSHTAESWLEIDILGLRRTLERKGKAWGIFGLVQNAWDTRATRVDVTLSRPNKDGMSTLTCRDNAPEGYRDLSEAHTLFGSSGKKADPTKRGRFNAGEKFVVVMCESAKVTSTTGQIIFQSNGKRHETDVITAAGTEFQGVLEMNEAEWVEVGRQVNLLLPPIKTSYNGVEVLARK